MSRPITSSTVFLVSGGARGITARCVVGMAQRYKCKFILLGRSSIAQTEPAYAQCCWDEAELKRRIAAHLSAGGEKPTPVKVQEAFHAIAARREIETTLHEIEQAGGQADYLSVDITEASALRRKVTESMSRLGAVTGIIHAAGNLADKLIEKKTAQDFETVYSAKVKGLENLLACVPASQLDYLVLFSSAAGFYGNAGQADYAIANEILNKAAHRLKQAYPACHVVSINWGPWDGGMVTPALKKHFAERNIEVIPVEVGAQMLIDELEAPPAAGEVQVLIGSRPGEASSPLGPNLRTFRLKRRLTLQQNPLLADHVVNSHAVLPVVCALAWVANACEQLYHGYKFHSCESYKVLKGIVFDETLADEYVLELKETTKHDGEIITHAMISSSKDDRPRYHYSAQVNCQRQKAPAPVYPDIDLSELDAFPGSRLYQDGTLFHGPRFHGVKNVLNLNEQRLTMQCVLPGITEGDHGQFPVQAFNYYMIDIGIQSMVIWARHFHNACGLPVSCRKIEHFCDVRPGEVFYVSMEVISFNETSLVANIVYHDEQRRVYARLSGAEIALSENLNSLFLLNRLPYKSLLTSTG